MAYTIIDSNETEDSQSPVWETKSMADDLKIEHILNVIDKYSLADIIAKLPE